MRQIETTYRAITAGARPGRRPVSVRAIAAVPAFGIDPGADREALAPKGGRRQPTPIEVLRTYDAGGRLRIRRMPPGYRMDMLV